MASRELAKRPGHTVDPEEEPSVEWGWHGSFPRATQVAGWISVLACLGMLNTNDSSLAGKVTVIGTAIVLAAGLVVHARRERRLRR